MCGALSVSKSAYYRYLKDEQESTDKSVEREVLSIFRLHKRRYGTRRIVDELSERGIHVGRKRVASIMAQYGLKAIQPKSYVPKTTQSPPGMLRSPNLLMNKPPPIHINQVWHYILSIRHVFGHYRMHFF